MSCFFRKLFVNVTVGGALLIPLALPAVAQAQPRAPVADAAPVAKPMTHKELHQHLARGAGWIRIFDGNGVRHGTGWILDREQKLMITNNHVVDGHDAVTVTFPIWKDGKLVTAESGYKSAPKVKAIVIDRDANRDLALIKVESIPDGMHALKLTASEPDEGDDIRTIGGFTNGGDGLVWGAVAGTVRACGPQELDPDKRRREVPVREILSDARTNGGNSGAPVVNAAGEVVAVHFAWKPWANGVSRHISVIELKAYLKEALPLADPKTAEQFLARATRRLAMGRIDTAIKDASAALEKEPKMVAALALRGRAFLAKNDPQTAIGDFNDALKLESNNYGVRVARGRALRAAGKPADAINDFSAAVRADPSKSAAYNERGLTHFSGGKFADAEADFGRAIETALGDAVLWGNRALARSKQGKHAEAATDWLKACELAPHDASYPNGLGLALLRLKKFDAAAEAFAAAVKITGAPLHLDNLGEALRLAGQHETAVKAFTAELAAWKKLEDDGAKVEPGAVADTYRSRAQCRFALKQYSEAAEDLTKAIELTGRKVPLYFAERALALDRLGERAAAEADRKAAETLGFKFEAPALVGGSWTGAYTVKGVKVTEVITFRADGTFEIALTLVGPGGNKKVTDSGTWSATRTTLTLNAKQLGKFVRPIEVNGDQLDLEAEELGVTIRYARGK
jgi:tetratricopeptide (TPR) repeat protein